MVSSNIPTILRVSVIWALAAAVAAPIIVFAANAMVALLALIAFAVSSPGALRTGLVRLAITPIGTALIGLIVWMTISLWWTPYPGDAAEKVARLALLWIAGVAAVIAAREADKRTLGYAGWIVPTVVMAALVIYALELASSAAIIRALKGFNDLELAQITDSVQREAARLNMAFNAIGRGSSLLAIFIWPAAALLLTRTSGARRTAGMLLISLFTLLALPMAAAPVGFIAGALAWGLCYAAPRRGPQLLVGLALTLLIAIPATTHYITGPESLGIEKRMVPMSWQHRLGIWNFVTGRIIEKPVAGWGFDSSRHIAGGETLYPLAFPDGTEIGAASLPLHPHNGVLQIWLELGIAGIALSGLFLFGLGQLIAAPAAQHYPRDLRLDVAMAAATCASAITMVCISFGLWQNWWQAGFWLAAVLVTLALHRQSSATR